MPWTLLRGMFALFLLAGAGVIGYNSLAYFGEELAPFVIEKLPLPREELWLGALSVHVVAASFSLPACVVLQFTKRASRFHRWLGRLTGVVVLLALVPSGVYMSFFAKGGLLGALGFLSSAAITAWAMVAAVRTARARRYAEHRRWALHVLAQLSVAVTSRALLIAFEAAALDAEVAYLVALWLPVVGSAAIVERKRHVLPLLGRQRSRSQGTRGASADHAASGERGSPQPLLARLSTATTPHGARGR